MALNTASSTPELRTARPLGLVLPAAIFFLTLLACSCTIYIDYRNSQQLLIKEKLSEIKIEGKLLQPLLQQMFEQAYQDVRFLSQMPIVEHFISDSAGSQQRLETVFSQMMETKPIYQKIRFIGSGNNGLELIRVNRENIDASLKSNIVITAAEDLQQKGHRYYMQETLSLPQGQVFFSRIELNRENGVVSLPHSPVIRVATPIYKNTGNIPVGIIIISVDFDVMKNKLIKMVPDGTDFYLSNNRGDYLIHPDVSKIFGFDLGQSYTLQKDFEVLSSSITNTTTDTALKYLKNHDKNNYLMYFSHIDMTKFDIKDPLYFLLLQDDEPLQTSINKIRNKSLLLGVGLSFIALVISLVMMHFLLMPLSHMTKAIEIYNKKGKRCPLPVNSRDEVGLLARSFNDLLNRKEIHESELLLAREAAESSAKSKSEFLANMSHEIRTPMNGVIGTLDLLLRGQLESKQQHYAKLAQSSAEGLLTVINDILDFSKIDANKLELEHIDFNIFDLLDEVHENAKLIANKKNTNINLSIDKNINTWVKGDPCRLRQIFNNLVGNAIKFTPHGCIDIIIEKKGINGIVFNIYDTGIGISPEKLVNLFDAFEQEDASTTREFGGTGLGLAITSQLIELMGGTLSVTSEKNKGSRFYFDLAFEKGTENPTIKLNPLNLSGLQILIVDDNATNRILLHDQLTLEGAVVTVAINGQDALRKLAQRPSEDYYSFIIIDMQMPDIDGIKLGHIIHRDDSLNDTRLILMSSVNISPNNFTCYELGFCASLTKPVRVDQLYHALRKAMQTSLPNKIQQNRVLLVDDNHVNLLVAEDNLTEMGVIVTTAENGEEAISALKANDFDMIFMDCMMPIMDGYQATTAIRSGKAGENNSQIPIIAMTANAMKGDDQKCFDVGMNDYITKPIDIELLQRTLKHWLKQPSTENSHPNNNPKSHTMKESEDSIDFGVWDKKSLLKRVRGKSDRVEKLVNIFIKHSDPQISTLLNLYSEKNYSELTQVAHAVKGSSANLSANRLSQSSGELEILAKQEKHSELENKINNVIQDYKDLRSLLKSEFNFEN